MPGEWEHRNEYGRNLDERVVEYPWVYSRLSNKADSFLDADPALYFDYLLSLSPIAEADVTICALAPEKRCYWKQSVSYFFDDPRAMKFGIALFDKLISIFTIEHIGLGNTMLYTGDRTNCEQDTSGYISAVQEFRWALKKGGAFLMFRKIGILMRIKPPPPGVFPACI